MTPKTEKSLLEIDEDILEPVNRIHELALRMERWEREQKKAKVTDEKHLRKSREYTDEVLAELKRIYHSVMEAEKVEKHLEKMAAKVYKGFEGD
jgi:hypothetical protein